MAQNLMQQLAKHEGYCCVYKFIRTFRGETSKAVAAKLGVTPVIVRRWRKRIRDGEVSCGYSATGCSGCDNVNVGTKRDQNTP